MIATSPASIFDIRRCFEAEGHQGWEAWTALVIQWREHPSWAFRRTPIDPALAAAGITTINGRRTAWLLVSPEAKPRMLALTRAFAAILAAEAPKHPAPIEAIFATAAGQRMWRLATHGLNHHRHHRQYRPDQHGHDARADASAG